MAPFFERDDPSRLVMFVSALASGHLAAYGEVEGRRRIEEITSDWSSDPIPRSIQLLAVLAELIDDPAARSSVIQFSGVVPGWVPALRAAALGEAVARVHGHCGCAELFIEVLLPGASPVCVEILFDCREPASVGFVGVGGWETLDRLEELLVAEFEASCPKAHVLAASQIIELLDRPLRVAATDWDPMAPFRLDRWPAPRPVIEWVQRLARQGLVQPEGAFPPSS